jgi:hypothetical protein
VVSYDGYGSSDYPGKASFDLSTERWDWGFFDLRLDPVFEPKNETLWFLFTMQNWTVHTFANIHGVMLVDVHIKPG